MVEELQPHRRRIRYKGTHPRRFEEKYKELHPEQYADQIEKLIEQGHTPAGSHRPICVDEILSVLRIAPGDTGLDATLGFGGHSGEILRNLPPGGKLFATDIDPIEMPKTIARLRQLGFGEDLFRPRQMNFAGLMKLLPETPHNGFDFVLADLGVSSMQLDDPKRGFSYKNSGPLDLRLNPQRGKSVAAMLREWDCADLEKMLRLNADERHSVILAEAIFAARDTINTTTDLSDVVRRAIAGLNNRNPDEVVKKTLPRVFQAFRIAVNGEFTVLEQFLQLLPYAVRNGGRIAILTFHSGEENRVLAAFNAGLAQELYSEISREPLRPSAAERYSNPRSKSAHLHWAIKK